MNAPLKPFEFFLGGRDLEMLVIGRLLKCHAPGRSHDLSLPWGARASAYEEGIRAALDAGRTPVLVELALNLPLPLDRIVLVDHHGDRAGEDKPTSLHQVFAMLGLPPDRWSRWLEWIAANDRGHVPAMLAAGATPTQAARVRRCDRAAQGISAQEEQAAMKAVAAREVLCGGRLTVVRLPHARSAAVADALDPQLGGPGAEALLVLSPAEANFYGPGHLVKALNEQFPGGWSGGNLPRRGFWGRRDPGPDLLPWLVRKTGQP